MTYISTILQSDRWSLDSSGHRIKYYLSYIYKHIDVFKYVFSLIQFKGI